MITTRMAFILLGEFIVGMNFISSHVAWADASPSQMSPAITAFEQHRLTDAMGKFLDILKQDPSNSQAHTYIDLIASQLATDQRSVVREKRLQMLSDSTTRLDANRMDSRLVQEALDEGTHSEEKAKTERWHAKCDTALIEKQMGHLLVANDLVLQVLSENRSFMEAQRLLSDLQAALRKEIDIDTSVPIQERYAYEGFYAYGQADYDSAVTAWDKSRALLDPGTDEEVQQQLEALHFLPYEKIARGHVDDEKQKLQIRTLFDQAVTLFQHAHYSEASSLFRQLAIKQPDYPQLAYYLVQSESAEEKDRSLRLGEEKRQEIASLFQQGTTAMEHENYKDAETAFTHVLRLDPSHTQAKSYLVIVRSEIERRNDPKAAQMHYESGLIAYASGKLDEAEREWKIAARMDPANQKATVALSKVQKELALNTDLP